MMTQNNFVYVVTLLLNYATVFDHEMFHCVSSSKCIRATNVEYGAPKRNPNVVDR